MLAQNLHANRALPRNDVGVIERMNEGKPQVPFEFDCVLIRIGIAVTV